MEFCIIWHKDNLMIWHQNGFNKLELLLVIPCLLMSLYHLLLHMLNIVLFSLKDAVIKNAAVIEERLCKSLKGNILHFTQDKSFKLIKDMLKSSISFLFVCCTVIRCQFSIGPHSDRYFSCTAWINYYYLKFVNCLKL